MLQFVFVWLLVALEAYLLGGIDFGIIISKTFYHDDVRTHGSGAAGMTNMLRTYDKKAASGTALGDVLKGVLAVVLARWVATLILGSTEFLLPGVAGDIAYVAGVFAIIGHTKPIYFGFKGGKGVLVAGGCILAIRPAVVLVLFAIFVVVFLCSRIVSLGSIIIASCYPFVTLVFALLQHDAPSRTAIAFIGAAIMGGMVVYMHRANIQRLRAGTEYRFGQTKK